MVQGDNLEIIRTNSKYIADMPNIYNLKRFYYRNASSNDVQKVSSTVQGK